MVENENDDFEELLKEQRHKELLYAVRSLKGQNDNSELVKVIISSIEKIIKNIPQPKVVVNNDDVATQLFQIRQLLVKFKEEQDKSQIFEKNKKILGDAIL